MHKILFPFPTKFVDQCFWMGFRMFFKIFLFLQTIKIYVLNFQFFCKFLFDSYFRLLFCCHACLDAGFLFFLDISHFFSFFPGWWLHDYKECLLTTGLTALKQRRSQVWNIVGNSNTVDFHTSTLSLLWQSSIWLPQARFQLILCSFNLYNDKLYWK